jgi:hypothetical protein
MILSKGVVGRLNWQPFIRHNYIIFKAGEHLLLLFKSYKFLYFNLTILKNIIKIILLKILNYIIKIILYYKGFKAL